MAKAKGTSKGDTIRIPSYFQIGIYSPDGKKIVKHRCTIDEVFETYFPNLDKYLNKGYNSEQLLELYQKTYYNKGIKVQIFYIDSWSHRWSGKVAWPKKEWFINYLNKRLNEKNSSN